MDANIRTCTDIWPHTATVTHFKQLLDILLILQLYRCSDFPWQFPIDYILRCHVDEAIGALQIIYDPTFTRPWST